MGVICVNDSYFKTIKDFRTTSSAKKLILNAMYEILPTKGNKFGFIFTHLIAVFFAVILGCSENTVELLSKVTGIMLNIQLAIFGCVFAVYSILLAFLSNDYMKNLAKIDYEQNTSMLKESTTYYESVLFLFFINIGLTGIITLLTTCISPSFRLTDNLTFDTCLAIVILIIYFGYSFRVFYELKSTIYNTIVLFRASIAYRFISFLEKSDDKKEDK
jgi:hypothetical protein